MMRTTAWHLALLGLVGAATLQTAIVVATADEPGALRGRAASGTVSRGIDATPARSLSSAPAGRGEARVAADATLGLPGRPNATPWVAAQGDFVAVVWGVSTGEKRHDVLLAVSRDGGATFTAPVRVNRDAGEARLGGELPPRVVLVPSASASPASASAASAPKELSAAGSSSSTAHGAATKDMHSRADPEIVVLWNARGTATSIKAARSHDGGRTFGAPVTLQQTDAAGDRGWPALAADRQGAVHAIWLDHRGLAAKPAATAAPVPSASASPAPAPAQAIAAGAVTTAVSTTAAAASAAPHGAAAGHGGATGGHHAMAADRGDGVANAQRSALYHASLAPATRIVAARTAAAPSGRPSAEAAAHGAVVSDRAVSAIAGSSSAGTGAALDDAAPQATAEQAIAPGVCYCCKTALIAGPDGALYAAWRHVYPGDLRDIAFSVSRDGGRTFAAPVRVSEDGWAIHGCPDDGPAMAIGADNTVHIVWPTVVGTDDEMRGALFYASTRDGRTFTPRQRIPTGDSQKPMHPQIAIDASGGLLVGWDEFIDGPRQVARLVAMTVRPDGTAAFGRALTLGGTPESGRVDGDIASSGASAGASSGARRPSAGAEAAADTRSASRASANALPSPSASTSAAASTAASASALRPAASANGADAAVATSPRAGDAQYPMVVATARGWLAVWVGGAPGATQIRVRSVSPAPPALAASASAKR